MDYKDTKDDISTDESCYINDSLPVHRSLSKQSNSIKKLKQLRATRGASFSKDLPTRFNNKYTNILVSPELQKSAEVFISNNPHGLNGNQIKDVAKEFCIYFSMISTKHPNVVPLEDILIPNYDDDFLDVIVQKFCFLGQSDFVPVFGTAYLVYEVVGYQMNPLKFKEIVHTETNGPQEMKALASRIWGACVKILCHENVGIKLISFDPTGYIDVANKHAISHVVSIVKGTKADLIREEMNKYLEC